MPEFKKDIALIDSISAVSTILDVVCQTTGMGFAAVARVTENRWIACKVKDGIQFGLKPGDELEIQTTICHEIRQSEEPVIISHVDKDEIYCNHATPRLYGFQSYISMPILLSGGKFFGTLCAIHPHPLQLDSPEIIGMFKLFSELIGFHIDASEKLIESAATLHAEREAAELRKQFIAMASRDIKDPLTAMMLFGKLLEEQETGPLNVVQREMVSEISKSGEAMLKVVTDYLDSQNS